LEISFTDKGENKLTTNHVCVKYHWLFNILIFLHVFFLCFIYKVAELTGHTNRILNLAMSPDGSTVLSAGADETLRMWKCFLPDPNKKKEHEKRSSRPTMLGPGLR